MSSPAARAAILHMLPAHLGSAGLRPDDLFGAGGMTAADTQSGAIVLRAQITAVLEATARALGEAHVGLTLGSAAVPTRLGRAGVALVSGSSLGECLNAHARQMPAMQTHLRISLRDEAGEAVWGQHFDGEAIGMSRILCEGAAAFHLSFMRSLLGPRWSPSRVVFPHALQGRRADYEDYFGAPVVFGAGRESRLIFDAALLRRPVQARRDPRDGDDLADPERALMTFRLRDERLLHAVRGLVASHLPEGTATLALAAGVLGLAPRTLQRRLGEAGVTFEEVVDALRRERALESIAAGVSVTEVAMSLGYSDTAHFTRAFRRWTGMTPSAFRNGGR